MPNCVYIVVLDMFVGLSKLYLGVLLSLFPTWCCIVMTEDND